LGGSVLYRPAFFFFTTDNPQMTPHRLLAIAVLLGTVASLAQAEASIGQTKARACAVCHGELGLATAPDTPNLAGQPERYLSEQLKAYRSGKRSHEVMSVLAKPLSDEDIASLAAWFASIKVEAQAPR
jgi:cytochrome c553